LPPTTVNSHVLQMGSGLDHQFVLGYLVAREFLILTSLLKHPVMRADIQTVHALLLVSLGIMQLGLESINARVMAHGLVR